MKKNIFHLLILCITITSSTIGKESDWHLVYVHIGDTIPPYAYVTFEQARLFNKNTNIILIANEKAFASSSYNFDFYNIQKVPCESLATSIYHQNFNKHSKLDPKGRDGFWRKTTERFFYIHEYMETHDINHVIHLEYDNMLYANIASMATVFEHYKGIAAVFDSDNRCIPSFMYIPHKKAIEHFVQFTSQHAAKGYSDMKILARYKKTYPEDIIDQLPIIMPEYLAQYPLINTRGQKPSHPHNYYKNIHQFNSIFDGSALGQYLGGIDPRNGISKPGFINETCIFNPSLLLIKWYKDDQQRNIPFALCSGKANRINNLHINSKKLKEFRR